MDLKLEQEMLPDAPEKYVVYEIDDHLGKAVIHLKEVELFEAKEYMHFNRDLNIYLMTYAFYWLNHQSLDMVG